MERKRVALMFICLNPHYWQYLKDITEDAKQSFLKDQDVDFLIWSDMPKPDNQAELEKAKAKITGIYKERLASFNYPEEVVNAEIEAVWQKTLESVNIQETSQFFPIEPIEWPMPTLMRYHLFLGQEEKLKEYDYLFYLDVDMRIVADIKGEEIMADGLTMAEHPMYATDRKFIPPYEPNPNSTAFINRLGIIVQDEWGKPWFKPLYAAGGFQGGKTSDFIEAMHEMKGKIDKDFLANYVAIWNDESHWNKYLSEHSDKVRKVLTPSYVHPDSMIDEYYVPIWGRRYPPKIVTLTKKFSLSREGGANASKMMKDLKPIA